ncbi:HNH endonuclease [Mucilaginibacter sp. McL0603]|uniref:HNH endonuclease n=1 Tax=Mucilaginibacter sp. McL0603 TaxID=3415670 RepID=UPI003CF7BB84
MDISINFGSLKVGEFYDRNYLTELWRYKGRQALSRGVVTPVSTNAIILFVTKEKQNSATQYNDYINDDFLYWEGEEKDANNNRIINAKANGDPIHLFYRLKHHTYFKYLGIIELVDFFEKIDRPLQFIFQVSPIINNNENPKIFAEPEFIYNVKETEKRSLSLSRIGQGKYRFNLLNLWDACAITNVKVPEILKASHIKPWKDSDNSERLDPYNGLILTPTLDSLFDEGFISFENNGGIILSKNIQPYSDLLNLSPDMKLRKVFNNNLQYLEYHRDVVYLK